ncbi:MAG TPA: glycoside hydrolase family 30 protein [Chitinophagaceae bacterium]|jgi:glucosylceramidase|nr:glycoside hydrolase family 30 protein [Chitinophagaceae bacterium]
MKRIITSVLLTGFIVSAAAQTKKIYSGQVYTTAAGTEQRISATGRLEFKEYKQPLESEPCVFINPSNTFQSFIGVGAALTDASAETFAKLPADKQQEFLTAYFDKQKGIGYTIGRTSIHSCDFSSGSYTYVNDGDKSLSSFNVKHDEEYRIPFIKKIIAAAGGKLTLYVSPWSPPAWMKDNNNMLQGGKLKKEYAQTWADYYIKFIKAYEAKGIPVWGLTVQNEPMAKQRWESCIFTAEEERDFIKNYLGPTLHKNGMASKKLIAWDHNRDLLYQRASVILSDAAASKYIWGVGFHWYETWTGGPMQFDNLKLVNQAFPSKNLIFTEGCKEKFNMDSVNNWALGEKYGYSMINDFNNGTVGWTDWNILLDETGGPNHVGNFCFAPVIADTKNGTLIYTNAYYYIGHFSKFIQPGAKRIGVSSSRIALQTTGFKNPDGSLVVVVMNTTDSKMNYRLWINGQVAITESLPHSINTLVVSQF